MQGRTRNALRRLAYDEEDALAVILLYEGNKHAIRNAVAHWLGAIDIPQDTGINLLLRIAKRARFYVPEVEDAAAWVAGCADMECRRLRNEIAAAGARHS